MVEEEGLVVGLRSERKEDGLIVRMLDETTVWVGKVGRCEKVGV